MSQADVEESLDSAIRDLERELAEANEELEAIYRFARMAYPDFPRGTREKLSSWIESLLKHKVRFTNGSMIFEVLQSSEAIRELTSKLEVELSDKAVADYLRVTADATDSEEEQHLLRAAADALEDPL